MPVHGGFENQWNRVRGALRQEVGDGPFDSWLHSMRLQRAHSDRVELSVPSSFIRHKVESRYGTRLRELWQTENPKIESIEIIIEDGQSPTSDAQNLATAPGGGTNGAEASKPVEPTLVAEEADENDEEAGLEGPRDDLKFRLVSRYTFDRFVVGPSNEFAYATARRVAEQHTPTMNPLFIHGPSGLGKSHLLQAIGWHIQKTQPKRRVLFLSAEQFMYEFVRALRHEDIFTFKERFRTVDVLLMDDIQFIANKDRTQDEFFHTFNALVDQNRTIVVSADAEPSNLEGLAERLKSRLKCGLVADILPTTYELRVSILQEKSLEFAEKFRPPARVLEFVAHKLPTNVRELEGALNRIVAHAELVNRPITIESVHELLQDQISQFERHITIDEIQRVVAEHFKIRVADMHSHRRMRSITRPRQIAMYLCKELTQRSLPEIGRKFGGRDHTTVIHAVRKVVELCSEDVAFREEVDILRRKLGG